MRALLLFCIVIGGFAKISFSEIPPPVLKNIEVGDSYAIVKWNAVKDAVGYNVYLKKDTGDYMQLNRDPIADYYVQLVDLANGMPYLFAVTALGAGGEESDAVITSMVVPVGYSHRMMTLKGGTRSSDYHIFSTPLIPDKGRESVEGFFAYLGKYDDKSWRIFTLENGSFKEFENVGKVKPGKAYWFLSREDTDIFLSGRTVNNYEPFFVKLTPGWNVVASPFLYPVDWDDVLAHNSSLARDIGDIIWEFSNGKFIKARSLQPYKGYFVYSSYEKDLDMLIPPVVSRPKTLSEATHPGYMDPEHDPSELFRPEPENQDPVGGDFALMIGIYPDKEDAWKMLKRLKWIGLSPASHDTEIKLKSLTIREGSYSDPQLAMKTLAKLREYGFDSKVVPAANGKYAVEIGRFSSGKLAERSKKSLKTKGFKVNIEAGWETANASELWLEDISDREELQSIKALLKKEGIGYFNGENFRNITAKSKDIGQVSEKKGLK